MLPDLPPELIELIAQQACPEDLLALRTSCRAVYHGLQRTFADVHFPEKTFLLPSPESMDMLAEISKHPTFGTRLKKINIHVLMISPKNHYWDLRHAQSKGLEVVTRDRRLSLREGRRLYPGTAEDHRQYWIAQGWQAPLVEALRNIKKSRGSVSLALKYYQSSKSYRVLTTAICGRKVIERRLGHDLQTDWLDFASEEQETLMQAIREGGSPDTSLVFGKQHRAPGSERVMTNFYDHEHITDKTLFAGLRALDVSLWVQNWRPDHDTDSVVIWQRGEMNYFIRFLSGAKHLEKLTLRRGYGNDTHCFEGLQLADKLPKLKELI
ncbi:hypothetical protein LTR56_023545 [Elasticomyces elasticus]|nr:hypothetical protein LTR56_023545 [Elasticomyces elasticus]KAK3649133.1 hypothetical protein LTR22_013103 [Elasticomyces elasticus]KAK4930010.1 hypothetical protein LTR49_003337 [Elasticomyces elasticus]KAK5745631.1 hypothetical protein LTS12_023019 [Elasticomyces elasticus]